MNILVLGNGFDLAHDLPTSYKDFLMFVNVLKDLYSKNSITNVNWGTLNEYIKNKIINNVFAETIEKYMRKEWSKLIDDNIWIEYFNQKQIKENWIDFESEIADVIKSLDEDMLEKESNVRVNLKSNVITINNEFLSVYYREYSFVSQCINSTDKKISFEEIRDRLLTDLNRLIRALEKYLSEYVNHINTEGKSPDIIDIKPIRVLSFNYTNTHERLYPSNMSIEYDYIHGKADLLNNVITNNMVLGIDEYLKGDRRNNEVDFIGFKKYFQRIHKQTGCRYKDWVLDMQTLEQERQDAYGDVSYKGPNNLFIFGHSLDVTDKDILKELIVNDNTTQTTIFYRNKETYGQQIANLVKVLGQEELIKRSGGPHKTITFKQQRPM